jgi:hypothetical protein
MHRFCTQLASVIPSLVDFLVTGVWHHHWLRFLHLSDVSQKKLSIPGRLSLISSLFSRSRRVCLHFRLCSQSVAPFQVVFPWFESVAPFQVVFTWFESVAPFQVVFPWFESVAPFQVVFTWFESVAPFQVVFPWCEKIWWLDTKRSVSYSKR